MIDGMHDEKLGIDRAHARLLLDELERENVLIQSTEKIPHTKLYYTTFREGYKPPPIPGEEPL
jgi:hypothetical protein